VVVVGGVGVVDVDVGIPFSFIIIIVVEATTIVTSIMPIIIHDLLFR
jgi:hypothetical protein